MHAPSRQNISEQLDRAECSLPTPKSDRVRDIRPYGPFLTGEMTGSEQIRDVRDDPWLARRDEPVVVTIISALSGKRNSIMRRLDRGMK